IAISKVKSFEVGRMTPEEAVENLDMLDHDFYVFVNDANDNVEIIYRRKDGTIGLLQPLI
ncbi:MAG: sigma 54 modulation/S30EA ribosomal C-terminal domain-containing protein, partial [Clostridia bacterium]|nr:sigma 54 modulation/S30EA ribosomal C-terminal domain-containing protein [Clostridia bacterium]